MHKDCDKYSTRRQRVDILGCDITQLDADGDRDGHVSAMFTVDHSYPSTYIRTFLAIFFSLLLSFSPTHLSGERLSVICRGLGGQIAIYSLPVGEVCVSRL